ncbi:nucleotide sugar dehydrogenase, partial [Thioclava sp. BHET1]
MTPSPSDSLLTAIATRRAKIGVIGLGYVGLPLAMAISGSGMPVTGFDIDPGKITAIEARRSYIEAVPDAILSERCAAGTFVATTDFTALSDCDIIVICVPTPLSKHRDPDLSYVTSTTEEIARHLRAGQMVVLESTTYPGTTDDILRPILEAGGLVSGRDFFLGYSPEREDPGNRDFTTSRIPKVVSGDGPEAAALMRAFY